ncbi:hypothetical protein [Deinococcus aquatilis]|uniref:hypothetical protein n=1 Tax=Deinococcus aquatilis TaxID=519440 RepID=UPI00036A2EF4|nr:hypothetical protein [Deinococcus aquatilis]
MKRQSGSRTFHDRKAERTALYPERIGYRLSYCMACNGSGHYDHNGSPRCGACGGSGLERVAGPTRSDFAGRHIRIRPHESCRVCFQVDNEPYGCTGKRPRWTADLP